jgi:hypothetical protein
VVAVVGPAVNPGRKVSPRADEHHAILRIEAGVLVWGLLSCVFLVAGLVQGFPAWALGIVMGGPLLLLLLLTRLPLADVPVVFVVLASLGGIGWEYVSADFPPWTVGLVFVLYLFGFEEALSGLVKLRHLRAIHGLRWDDPQRRRLDDDHSIARKRIWGYLLATGSSAVIIDGLDDGGTYHRVLLALFVLTFLLRSQVFGALLVLFSVTRFLGDAVTEGRRWLPASLSLANALAYGIGLHWLVTYGSAFGAHPVSGWNGETDADGWWYADFETIAAAMVLWGAAALNPDWTG